MKMKCKNFLEIFSKYILIFVFNKRNDIFFILNNKKLLNNLLNY